jgi:alkylated DNA repair protein alkB family protein 8
MIDIQAWALEQEAHSKRQFAAQDVFVPFKVQPKFLTKDAWDNGAEVDPTNGLVVFERYCHVYKKDELMNLVAKVPNLALVERGYDSGNYYIRVVVTE